MRINIVGLGPGWEKAPSCASGLGEVWGVNGLILRRPVDLLCEMHNFDWTAEQLYRHQFASRGSFASRESLWGRVAQKLSYWKQIVNALNKTNTPFLSVKEYEQIPSSIKFPFEWAKSEFPTDFYTCGICYMVAYAIYKGASEIHVYGCRMEIQSEYKFPRGGVQFWLGVAVGRGIHVTVYGGDIYKTRTGRPYHTYHEDGEYDDSAVGEQNKCIKLEWTV